MELALYRYVVDRKTWRKPSAWAFIILRYSVFLSMIPAIWFTALPTQHCQLATAISQGGIVLVTASAGVIFAYRAFALWNFQRWVCICVCGLWVVMVTCWTLVATHLLAQTGPPTPLGSNCALAVMPAWTPVSYASSVLFDTVILVLTIMAIRQEQKKTHLTKTFMTDNLCYFIAVTITNVVNLAIQSLEREHELEKATSIPWPTIITVAMGSRVYLNLRLFENQRGRPNIWGGIQPTTIKLDTMRFSNPALVNQDEAGQIRRGKFIGSEGIADIPRVKLSSEDRVNYL